MVIDSLNGPVQDLSMCSFPGSQQRACPWNTCANHLKHYSIQRRGNVFPFTISLGLLRPASRTSS
eukprot:10909550-Lingulodinium_polyedra.AAC.1